MIHTGQLITLATDVMDIARRAGDAIMAVYQSGNTVTHKADSSPLTEADLQAHRIIVHALAGLTPDIPVLSEESAEIPWQTRRGWQCFWLVDPLDGTKEFIKRNGEFTVNIALIKAGQPILGVVHAPVPGTTYWAAQGVGAFKRDAGQQQTIHVSQRKAGEPIRVVASRSHADPAQQAMLDALGEHQCISMGSSLKLCLVAEGAAHLYPRLGPTMEWDTAAAHAIVAAAGGRVTDFDGNELHYNKPDLHNPPFVVLARQDAGLLDIVKGG